MPNIANVLRSEIRRLAQKEAKSAVGELKKENNELKRVVADLKRRLDQVEKQAGKAPAAERSYVTQVNDARARITGQMIRGLRERFALTQSELAHLLDVSAQSVYQWERNLGSLNLRQRTMQAVNDVREMGKREVKHRLEQAGLISERRRGPIARGGKKTAAEDEGPAKAPRKKRAAKKKAVAKTKATAKKKAVAKRKPAARKAVATGAVKRGPGRPRGSKNKRTT